MKTFTVKATINLEIAMFIFDFLNLPASWIVLRYFHLTGTYIKYKMSLNKIIYKKCSSYSFLLLKVRQTSECYKNTKDFGNSVNLVNEKNNLFLRMLSSILILFLTKLLNALINFQFLNGLIYFFLNFSPILCSIN